MKVVACTSYNKRFAWESYCFLNNLREKGYSNDSLLLVYIDPNDQIAQNSKYLWDKMVEDFKEVEFFFWEDKENFIHLTKVFSYIPLIRPKLLMEYWKLHPEMEKTPFFYVDTDILFYREIDFSKYLKDDIIYISNAKSYTNSEYFDSKKRFKVENGVEIPEFIQPSKWQAFKSRDLLNEFGNSIGVNREIIESNKDNSGAAQYLLKNINLQNIIEKIIKLFLAYKKKTKNHNSPIEKDFYNNFSKFWKENPLKNY